MLVLFVYITRLASNEIFLPSNTIHREVGRAKVHCTPVHCRLRKQAEVQYEGSHNCLIRICLLDVDSDKFTFTLLLLYSGRHAKV